MERVVEAMGWKWKLRSQPIAASTRSTPTSRPSSTLVGTDRTRVATTKTTQTTKRDKRLDRLDRLGPYPRQQVGCGHGPIVGGGPGVANVQEALFATTAVRVEDGPIDLRWYRVPVCPPVVLEDSMAGIMRATFTAASFRHHGWCPTSTQIALRKRTGQEQRPTMCLRFFFSRRTLGTLKKIVRDPIKGPL